MPGPGALRLTFTLTVGILAVSCGSIFVRLAAAPALSVAAYRVSWATVLLAPLVWAGPKSELLHLPVSDWRRLCLSGTALALHFSLWIASLSYTSVASSVLLVDTTPFFIGLASHFLLGRPCSRAFWLGLGAAFLGCIIIFQEDLSNASNSLNGNLLALGGAVAMAVYLLIGGNARQKLSLLAYVWPVYATAALVLLLASVSFDSPLSGFPLETHLFLFLLGLVPQCIGHTTYNWSLRWLPPAFVGLVGLAEPVGATVLAWMVLEEGITLVKIAGGAVVLAGIFLATRGDVREVSQTKKAPSTTS